MIYSETMDGNSFTLVPIAPSSTSKQNIGLTPEGNVESETQTPGGAQSQTVNVNHDCCDSSITEGSDELMGNHDKRGAALEEFSADQSLYDSSTLSYGSMNKLSEPWLSALDDTQASQTMSFFHDPLEDQHRHWINLEKGNIDFTLDERTGRIRATVYDPNTGSDVVLSGSNYDPFGRRTTSTEYSSGTPSGTQYYQNDWLSGDIRAQRTTDIDGSVEHYFNHAPGWSRRMYNTGSGYSESWLIRGPLGQVSDRNDDSGTETGNYQYGSWGNRLPGSTQTGSNPEYYDAYSFCLLTQEFVGLQSSSKHSFSLIARCRSCCQHRRPFLPTR